MHCLQYNAKKKRTPKSLADGKVRAFGGFVYGLLHVGGSPRTAVTSMHTSALHVSRSLNIAAISM